MNSIENSNFYINLFSLIGVFIAAYTYYVKKRVMKNPSYKAICDLNENISCSRVIVSKYGSGFGIVGKLFGEKSPVNFSNSILGIIFYLLQIALTFYNQDEFFQFVAFSSSFTSILGSIYLAYILYFVLKDFCIVCNLSYICNGIIFYYNWQIFMYN